MLKFASLLTTSAVAGLATGVLITMLRPRSTTVIRLQPHGEAHSARAVDQPSANQQVVAVLKGLEFASSDRRIKVG